LNAQLPPSFSDAARLGDEAFGFTVELSKIAAIAPRLVVASRSISS